MYNGVHRNAVFYSIIMDSLEPIKQKIYEIRGQRVMQDRDLAELYQVTTGNLNKAVKRNIRRFPHLSDKLNLNI